MKLPKRRGWRQFRLALAVVTVVGIAAAVAEAAIPYIGSPFLESGAVTNYIRTPTAMPVRQTPSCRQSYLAG